MIVDLSELVSRLEKAVELNGPNYRYGDSGAMSNPCKYFWSNKPACIFGVAFENDLRAYFKEIKKPLNDETINFKSVDSILIFDSYDTEMVANRAQLMQDSGNTWGEVLNYVKSAIEDRKSARQILLKEVNNED
jgi:hypothetical protein